MSDSVEFKEHLALAFLKLSATLPLWLSRGLGRLSGQIAYWGKGKSCAVTAENLHLCFPHLSAAERDQLVRRSLIETGQMMMETGAVWLRDYDWVKSKILKVHNSELLHKGLDDERGLVLLAPHLGNWEVLGLYLSEVADVTSLYEPPAMKTLEPVIRQSREKVGAKLVPTNRKGVVALMKTIKAGGFTAILPDQVPDASGGKFAPFYGVPALTMTLVNSLRQRSGCQVIAGYAERVKGGFEIHFLEADNGIDSDDDTEALAAMNRSVEKCVDQIPAQYQWEYKRFRKQPEGLPKRYKS